MNKNNIDEKKKSVTHSTKKETATLKSRIAELDKKLETASGKKLEPYKFSGIVYLLIDCSLSMKEGNKMSQAKNGAAGFADEAIRRGYSIGLIKFAGYATHILEPQNELARLKDSIERIGFDGGTNITDAIKMATDRLKDERREKVMCIVTDGNPYPPDCKENALDAAYEARSKGIDIMTIGTDDADKDFLRLIASRSDFVVSVKRTQLAEGIASAAKLLHQGTKQ